MTTYGTAGSVTGTAGSAIVPQSNRERRDIARAQAAVRVDEARAAAEQEATHRRLVREQAFIGERIVVGTSLVREVVDRVDRTTNGDPYIGEHSRRMMERGFARIESLI
jgi:hypothetical protein